MEPSHDAEHTAEGHRRQGGLPPQSPTSAHVLGQLGGARWSSVLTQSMLLKVIAAKLLARGALLLHLLLLARTLTQPTYCNLYAIQALGCTCR